MDLDELPQTSIQSCFSAELTLRANSKMLGHEDALIVVNLNPKESDGLYEAYIGEATLR